VDDLEAHQGAEILHALEVIAVENHAVQQGHGVVSEEAGAPLMEHGGGSTIRAYSAPRKKGGCPQDQQAPRGVVFLSGNR
jgi:hypothetical protein